MSELFFVDAENQVSISWDNFITRLNEIETYLPHCAVEKPFEIILQIVLSILANKAIVLIDSDLSIIETKQLGIDPENINIPEKVEFRPIRNKKDLITRLVQSSNWQLSLFTSGTTGQPKKAAHKFHPLTRSVKSGPTYKNNTWGFAYNPTHMAGLQVLFQALLNQNTIVNLFGRNRNTIFQTISDYKITNISATPTFFRMLLPCEQSFQSVRKITTGGEALDGALIDRLSSAFPLATLRNVYATTETGSLLASNSDIFTIKDELKKK